MADTAKVVLKEGAETFGVTHLATLQAEEMDGNADVVARALMDAALRFAGYLHTNAEPMFLHSLRAFFEYQDFACPGCQASTQVVSETLALQPPTDEQLASLIAQDPDGDDELMGDSDITARLREAMEAVEEGASIHEALEAVGGRVIIHTGAEDE